MDVANGAGIFAAVLTAVNTASLAITAVRCRRRGESPQLGPRPPVSLVRPVCGRDQFDAQTLRSSFAIEWPAYEVIFCVATANDASAPLLRRLIAENPHVPARLLIGDDEVSANPKLNNCVKGWRAARHEWIILADSNVLIPPDYIARLMSRWRSDTGLVASPPVVSQPEGFFGDLECAFMNTYQTRWQFAAEAAGFGFAQGKTMLWRRSILEAAGGIEALACEPAEDAAATKIVRRAGLHVRLADRPFEQPIGRRSLRQIWSRQARWARLRRATFPLCFIPEILTGTALPALLAAWWAIHRDINPISPALAVMVVAWGGEWLLAGWLGWHRSLRLLLAVALRDLLLPVLWIDAWLGNDFVWRGNAMTVGDEAAGSGRAQA